ncbi:hypothetical protein LTR84_011124 [Exophiala bonariae]|uniref:CCHC-type domain-containing protein n=1 Tax=Exophiala bonariae TaxID=1690606 RepID=A0AAV9NJV7_9EURO|nr:hypothetical protein LTR84_011124 [Exophiala bonariae]
MASDPNYCKTCGAYTHNTNECPGKPNKHTGMAASLEPARDEKACNSSIDGADWAEPELPTAFEARMRDRELECDAELSAAPDLEFTWDGGCWAI